jgi:hypothetical protein
MTHARGRHRQMAPVERPQPGPTQPAETHINRIFHKTGARDRAQAVRYAYERGFV